MAEELSRTHFLANPAESADSPLFQHLTHITGASHEGICVVDSQGTICAWSPGAERIFGYSAAELIGQPEIILLPPHLIESGEVDEIRNSLNEGKSVENRQTMRVGKNGQPIVIELSCINLYEQGRIVGRSQLFRDLTETTRMERKMRQSQRLVTVAQLVTGLAHDIGTPLNVIAGRAELLANRLSDDDPMKAELQVIMRESQRLTEIISTLLQFARGSNQVRLRRCSLNEAIQETLRLTTPQLRLDSIQIQCELMPELPLIIANRTQLIEIVLNLVFNAMHAMPEGGTLRLETSMLQQAEGEYVQLRVSDTGHGIAPEDQQQIFKPFFSTKPPGKGTGLGLTMVASIVQQHGGKIDFTSALGEGSTFTVLLPIKRESLEHQL